MKDPQKIHNYFKPILEGLENPTKEEKKATQVALESFSNNIRSTPSLPSDSIDAIQEGLSQLRLLSPNDTELQRIADNILRTITPIPSSSSSAIQSPPRLTSSPRFILNPSLYQNNTALSPTYYEEHFTQAIHDAALALRHTLQRNKNAPILHVFQNLALTRKNIAIEQKSLGAEDFGVKRDGELVTEFLPGGPYDEYEKKILGSLSQLCQANKEELLQKGSFEILGQEVQGIPSKFSCNLINKAELLSVLNRIRPPTPDQRNTVAHLGFILQNAFDILPEKKEDVFLLLNQPHIGLMHTTTRATVSNESCPLTEYFFFFNQAELEKDLPQFSGIDLEWRFPSTEAQNPPKTPALLTLHHSQPYYGTKLVEYINKHQLPLCLASKTLPELKENIGVFLYLSAQATLYKRGSASIAEMQAKTICEAFGYKLEYGKEFSTEGKRPLTDLDALTSITLDEYMVDFLSKIELTPIS